MSAFPLLAPYPVFLDTEGKPLQAGKLYFGPPNQNPESVSQTIYWDAAATQPAAQPVATLNGVPMRGGAPGTLYSAGPYSLTVRDSRGRLVTNIADSSTGADANSAAALAINLNNGFDTTKGTALIQHAAPGADGPGSVNRLLQSKLNDIRTVRDKGAVVGTGASQTAAFQNAANDGIFIVTRGTWRMDTDVTTPAAGLGMILLGSTFNGAASYDQGLPGGKYPYFPGVLRTIARGSINSFVGIAHNDLPASTVAFPTGTTGYGRNDNAGNCVFGGYFEGRQYAATGVVCGAEIDSFMHNGAATDTTQPNRSIGTTQQHGIALTLGAGGSATSTIALQVVKEGSSPQQFFYGHVFDANAIVNSAIVVEASTGVGPSLPVLFKHKVAALCMQVQGVGVPSGTNAWLQYVDGNGVIQHAEKQNGDQLSGGISGSTSTAPSIASAATIAPTKRINFVSGSAVISNITVPTNFAATGCTIILIPTGTWTTDTAGNIGLASTAVGGKAMTMTYDAATAKWYPSY